MKNGFITFRSVTYAQRGESVVRKAGIQATVQRTPKWMEELGCGYCLNLDSDMLSPAVRLLRERQVPYRKVYLRHSDGRTEEAAL